MSINNAHPGIQKLKKKIHLVKKYITKEMLLLLFYN